MTFKNMYNEKTVEHVMQ